MSSSGKKKTTMAKLARESRLRERRAIKQAKKNDRRAAPADNGDTYAVALNETSFQSSPTVSPQQPALADVAPPADV